MRETVHKDTNQGAFFSQALRALRALPLASRGVGPDREVVLMCADHAAVRRPRKGQEQCCCRRRASLSLLPHSEPLAALQRALWLPLCGPIALPRGREGNLKVVHTLAKSRRRAQASALSAATVLISALDCAPWFRRLGSLAHIFRARSRTGDVAKQSYVLIHTGETKLKRKKQTKTGASHRARRSRFVWRCPRRWWAGSAWAT